jgi:hypothetical protein
MVQEILVHFYLSFCLCFNLFVVALQEYANLHFHLPDRPISIPLDKDCRETDWLGDQEPIDTGVPDAPKSISEEGEEEVEEASDVPSDSERSAYEEPPSHSRVGFSSFIINFF